MTIKSIQHSDLFDLGKILASESAPTEEKGFPDDETGRWISYEVRLGTAWSNRECESVIKKIYNAALSRMSNKMRRQVIDLVGKNKQAQRLRGVLIAIAVSEYTKEELKEYAPMILKEVKL